MSLCLGQGTQQDAWSLFGRMTHCGGQSPLPDDSPWLKRLRGYCDCWIWMMEVCFTLSMRGNLSNLYWVYGGICLLRSEYAGKWVIFTLSMRRNSSDLYWVCGGQCEICLIIARVFNIGCILLAIMEVFLKLSMLGNSSDFHWVCRGIHLLRTEYAGESVIFILSMRRNLSDLYRVCGSLKWSVLS